MILKSISFQNHRGPKRNRSHLCSTKCHPSKVRTPEQYWCLQSETKIKKNSYMSIKRPTRTRALATTRSRFRNSGVIEKTQRCELMQRINLSLMNRISENIWKMSFLALREERHPMLKGMLMRVRCQTETLGYGDAQMMLL